MPAVGGVVWIQCGERASGIVAGFERVCDDALGRSGGSHRLAGRGVAPYRSGAVAGLATVTQGAGFVCFNLVVIGNHRLGCDDTLDAFGVHGAGGIIGATLTGVVATRAVNDALKLANGEVAPLGWVDGGRDWVCGGRQLGGAEDDGGVDGRTADGSSRRDRRYGPSAARGGGIQSRGLKAIPVDQMTLTEDRGHEK